MAQDLRAQFDEAMFTIYRRAKSEAKYNATIFLGMLHTRRGLGHGEVPDELRQTVRWLHSSLRAWSPRFDRGGVGR